MRIISGVISGATHLASLKEPSQKARQRLKWFDYYNSHNHNARLTCRHFDISPQTFYRWKGRYNPKNIVSLEAHSRATSNTASGFIGVLLERMPFPIKAIQVDGGAEFQDAFEEECQRRGIKLFVLPPRSPKLNGHVEKAQRTHTEEFYEVTEASFEIPELNKALLKWEEVYNTIRPHQALGYLTPLEFLEQYQQKRREVMCH